jgi:methyl-accepting chemotaxis protein
MLNRVSINALLKSVIVALCASLVVVLSLGAWDSWQRVRTANRIAAVANVSTDVFKALHNIRSDRSRTVRAVLADRVQTLDSAQLRESREASVPALQSALATLRTMSFPDQSAIVSEFDQRLNTVIRLHAESLAAMARPKGERPASLAKTIHDEMTAFIAFLDKFSVQLNRMVKLEDGFVDQLMEVKQLAWMVRDRGGDASVIVSNGMSGQPLPQDPWVYYTTNLARMDQAWEAMLQMAAGLPMPAKFHDAVELAKKEFFGRDYTETRTKILKELISGQKPSVTVQQWSPVTVPKLATVLAISEVALDVAKEHTANQHAAAMRSLIVQLGLLMAAIALAAGMILLVTRRVIQPLMTIQQAMLKLAGGDFNVTLPGLDRQDEVGAIANAVEKFKVLAVDKGREEAEALMRRQQADADLQAKVAGERAKEAEERAKIADEQARAFNALGDGLGRLSEGDLTFRLDDRFPEAYREVKDNFNTAIERLYETIRAIAEASGAVANAAVEITTSTSDLSQRTEEQAASLERTSSAMEEISATMKNNADNARNANQVTSNTRERADRGGDVVAKAVRAMSRIEDSSTKISDIIGVIDEIARQTNLLALNAAVEAARAGDAGRGFAVVASEVRSLAQRSSEAAKDIKSLIVNSSTQVQEGVQLVNSAGNSLEEILGSIKEVATIVSEIASTSAEQSTGIDHVNTSLTQMDEATQQNAALVEENAATAKVLEQQSQAMSERVAFFKLGHAVASAPSANAPSPASGARSKAATPKRAA